MSEEWAFWNMQCDWWEETTGAQASVLLWGDYYCIEIFTTSMSKARSELSIRSVIQSRTGKKRFSISRCREKQFKSSVSRSKQITNWLSMSKSRLQVLTSGSWSTSRENS